MTPFLLMLFGMVAVVSVVGGITYSIARLLDRKQLFMSFLLASVAIAFTIFLLILVAFDPNYLFVLLWLLFCSGMGSWFHKTSGGKSGSLADGFLLMFITSKVTLFLSFLALALSGLFTSAFDTFALDSNNYPKVDMGIVFAVVCFTAPMAITAFLRVFQVMKLRPGIDRAFDAREDRS